jgi:hypothetical protein
MSAIAVFIMPVLEKYGPFIASKLLVLAFPDDPIRAQWIAVFGEMIPYDEQRSAAFKAAGKTETQLPPA